MNDKHLQDNALELCKAQLNFYLHFIGELKSLRDMLQDMNDLAYKQEKELLGKYFAK